MKTVWKDDTGLYGAAKRFFGGWTLALEAAGFPPNRQSWSKELIVEAIQKTRPDLNGWDANLSGAACRYFGDHARAFQAAGFEIEHRRWSKRAIIDAIRAQHREGTKFSRFQAVDPPLFTAAKRYFGSWKQAVEASGYKYDSGRKWTRDLVLQGLRTGKVQDKSLAAAVRRYFGSWSKALAAAEEARDVA